MEDVSPRRRAVFEAAVEHVNRVNYPSKHRTVLGGLYKHVTVGPCLQRKSSFSKFTSPKFEAWRQCQDLSLEQAMARYVEYVSKIDDTFDSEEAEKEATNELKDMDTLPPPLPPALQAKYFRTKTQSSPNVMQEIQKQSGFDPENDTFDDENRIQLHEKLVKYYRAVDPSRLLKGIGEIVDLGLSIGEEKLNEKLKKAYGIDLAEMEYKEQRRVSVMKKKLAPKSSFAVIRTEKFTNFDEAEAVALCERIEEFFQENDPSKVIQGRETGYIEIIRYCDKKGTKKFNEKLIAKYGKGLKGPKKSKTLDSMPPKKKAPVVTANPEDTIMRITSNLSSKRFNNDSFSDLRSSVHIPRADSKGERESKGDSIQTGVNVIDIPEYVKPALVNFYLKFDPERLSDGSVKKIFKWTRRHGLRKLNSELRKRYKQSLDEFCEEADTLKRDLEAFYNIVDASKIHNGMDKISSWGIKNGRKALNAKLMKKYGFDLDTYGLGEPPKSDRDSGSVEV